MNCDDAKQVLDAFAVDALSGPPRAAVEAHLESCAGCRAELAKIQATARLLRAVRIPQPPADLAARLLPAAVERSQRRRWRRRTAWAMAAAVLLSVALGVQLGQHGRLPAAGAGPQPTVALTTVTLAPGAPQTVALEFNARRALPDVRFELRIPRGFELAGHEGKHSLAWSGELRQGRNRLNLHLTARPGSAGVLTARLRLDRHQDQEVFKVALRTAQENSATDPLRDTPSPGRGPNDRRPPIPRGVT